MYERGVGQSPFVSARGGSGTIFFSGCTMRCGFCQNRQISRGEIGSTVELGEFVDLLHRLQESGALNLNLVSASHFAPSVVEAVYRARQGGFSLPVLWNSSGYETLETLEALREMVDVYLPDLKLLDHNRAGRLFGAKDYPSYAEAAVEKMISISPPRFSNEGLLVKGTMLRHLVLPGLLDETERVLRQAARLGVGKRDGALLSLMLQFGVPQGLFGWKRGVSELENRPLTRVEEARLVYLLEELEMDEGYMQEQGDDSPWWPDFSRRNPFPPQQAVPLWHYREAAPINRGR